VGYSRTTNLGQVKTLPGSGPAVHDNHIRVPPAEISPTQTYISLSKKL